MHITCKVLENSFDHESGHSNIKSMRETEMEKETVKLVVFLEKEPRCEDITAENISEWMANDELHEITYNDITEVVKQAEIINEEEQKP